MVNIETIDDLVRALQHDPEVQRAVKSVVLGDGFHELPEEIRAIRETQTSILEEQRELRKDTNALRGDTNAILEEQRELRKDTNALIETQNAMLETMSVMLGDLTTLNQNSSELRNDLATERQARDRFRGNYAIDTAERNPFGIMEPFARGNGIRRARYQLLNGDQLQEMVDRHGKVLDDLVEEQAQAGVPEGFAVTDNAISSFRQADLVIEVSRRSPERSPVEFYVLVEASYTGSFNDVRRACVRAKVLRRITGKAVYPVTAAVALGDRLDPKLTTTNVTDLISNDNEHVAFWYELKDENLQPSPAR